MGFFEKLEKATGPAFTQERKEKREEHAIKKTPRKAASKREVLKNEEKSLQKNASLNSSGLVSRYRNREK
jgi:hypothetical protein